jgi:hypothetical protein
MIDFKGVAVFYIGTHRFHLFVIIHRIKGCRGTARERRYFYCIVAGIKHIVVSGHSVKKDNSHNNTNSQSADNERRKQNKHLFSFLVIVIALLRS